jgi:hypothetical protein
MGRIATFDELTDQEKNLVYSTFGKRRSNQRYLYELDGTGQRVHRNAVPALDPRKPRFESQQGAF